MCRSRSQGGRRCTGHGGGRASTADRGQQDRDDYERRAAEFRAEVATGKPASEVIAERQAANSRRLLQSAIEQDESGGARSVPAANAGDRPAYSDAETEADRRFSALRESGYTGPIDQDGNRADGYAEWEAGMRQAAAENGYEVIKGGAGYVPPPEAFEMAERYRRTAN